MYSPPLTRTPKIARAPAPARAAKASDGRVEPGGEFWGAAPSLGTSTGADPPSWLSTTAPKNRAELSVRVDQPVVSDDPALQHDLQLPD
ncbi:hypothetical protein [Streptomyces bottropensis]|uniref:hypothetical protein n=1 Tax=Streptomyces bottropensis TaxID=42235 RepID=UPI0036A52D3F